MKSWHKKLDELPKLGLRVQHQSANVLLETAAVQC